MNSINNPKMARKGDILLAEPFMWDPNFRRGAVLVCGGDGETTVGLLLSRPLQLELNDILPKPWRTRVPLYYGGPVEHHILFVVHRYSHLIMNSVPIVGDIAWSGNMDQIEKLLQEGRVSLDRLRFFMGYTGWDIEQLREEIDTDSWIIAKAKADYVFTPEAPHLWRNMLLDMGGNYQMIANYPENPILN